MTRLKLDENLGESVARLFRTMGHDAATVHGQSMGGAGDQGIIDHCRREQRCLVTCDLDFADPRAFNPAEYSGIAVLRLASPITEGQIQALARTLGKALKDSDVAGRLWIVQPGRIRIHEPESE